MPENALQGFPECSNSLVTYGLTDFADRSLSSPSDRAYICDCLEKTIVRHEPRLRKVKAMLEVRDDNSVNRLKFSITALLVVSTSEEPVNFDALLQPSTLQYSISKAGRGAMAGVRVWQRDLRMRVVVGPLDHAGFTSFLPGGLAARALESLLGLLASVTLDYEVALILRGPEVRSTVLGPAPGGRLGRDAYLVTGPQADNRGDVRYDVQPMQRSRGL